MQIRPMDVGDVDGVAAIEACSPSPWSEAAIAAELRRSGGYALVATEENGEVAAWCCGLQVGVEAELLKIAVVPGGRRKGLARSLLTELCSRFTLRGVEKIFLEVRGRNHPALQLYSGLGWRETGRRSSYYSDPVDDAVMLVRRI